MRNAFRLLFEHSSVAMLVVDRTGTIVLVNQCALQMFRYASEGLLGTAIERLVPDPVRATHPGLLRSYFENPEPRQMGQGRVLFAVRSDGSQFPVEVALNQLDIDGQPHALASVIDITDRHRAEERFRGAFEAAPCGMLMIDTSRRIVLLNRRIEEIFGYRRDELLGQPIEVLVPKDVRARHPDFVASYFTHPESRTMGSGRELFGRHRSGHLVPVEIGLQPVHSPDGIFVISSVVDISLRRKAEEAIQRKTEELEEFAYRTSHDLRSPLKSIVGMSDMAAELLTDGDVTGVRDCLARIGGLCEKLSVLTENIMALAKVDSVDEAAHPFDFEAHAALAAEKFSTPLAEGGVRLECEFAHTRPLLCQATRLGEVLDNLVDNAIKYADPRKPDRYVRLQTTTSHDGFTILVADNGTGVPEARRPEVFGMFKRFHGPTISGSGLGLYIVHRQVQRLGATISFESSPAGTVFRIEFPNLPADDPTPPADA